MAIRKPGPYAPLSAHYADDERIIEAGEAAELLYCRMLAYAARTPLTEGWIPESVVLTRLGFDDSKERVERLLSTGLVEIDADGYQIVSWLRWNRSAEEMGKERGRDRNRKARDQALSGNSAGNDAGKHPGNDAGEGDEFPPTFPLSNQYKSNTNQYTESARVPVDLTAADFDAFWSVYPKRKSKGSAVKAYKAARKKATAEQIMTGLRAALPGWAGKPEQYIPYPATWLNGERWLDDFGPSEPVKDDEYYRNLPPAKPQWSV